jgi:hypothetical protein
MSVKRLLVAAGGVLALATTSANAAFTFSTTRDAITSGAFAGLERINLILSSDQPTYSIGAAAVDTFGLDSTGQAVANALKFRVPSLGNPDVYAPPGIVDVLANSFNPGLKGSFAGLSDGTNLATPEPNSASKPAYAAGMDTYNVVGFYTTPLDVAKTDAPAGIVIASAVVPAGTTVKFSGNVDNDLDGNNGTTVFAEVNPGTAVPEPAGLCFLGVVGAAAFGRRRRQA